MYCYAQTKAAENGETFTNAIKPGNPHFLWILHLFSVDGFLMDMFVQQKMC